MWIRPEESVILELNAGEIVESEMFSAGLSLRFPRITRVRYDKNSCEIESEATLWETFNQVEESRRDASRYGSIQMQSPVVTDIGTGCRFLTENQYALSKKSKPKKALRQFVGVPIPSATKETSCALRGIVFAVIGSRGFYMTVDEMPAIVCDEAHHVKNVDAVKRFIQMHGGTCLVDANPSCDFVLGGCLDDPKVVKFIKAIENARSALQNQNKSKSLSYQRQEKMASFPGVLQWIFVFTLVRKWQITCVDLSKSIREMKPEILRPTILEYLGRPEQDKDTIFDKELLEMDLSNVEMMHCAINFVDRCKKTRIESQDPTNWRKYCLDHLEEGERWVAASPYQTLWPYRNGLQASPRLVLYPCIDNSSAPLNSNIEAVLPLARVMGAFVSRTLDQTVTHVLCHLTTGHQEIKYNNNIHEDCFADVCQGRKLLLALEELDTSYANFNVSIVSPRWLRSRVWKTT